MSGCYGIILAAGEGKRMKSKLPKVLHKICGKAMVDHVIDALKGSNVEDFVVVVGHGADIVKSHFNGEVKTSLQEKQLGTAHAVLSCIDFLKGKEGTVIVLAGDAPLITNDTISRVFKYHNENNLSCTVLTADADNPKGFGRIVRNTSGEIERIVEDKDATNEEKLIKEINSSTYCFDIKTLIDALDKIGNNNAQGEYYLTDTVEIIKAEGKRVGTFKVDFTEFMGVNSRQQLYEAAKAMKDRINNKHMSEGVTIIDPENTYIEANVKIGMDTVIYPNTILEGETIIGEDCTIGPNSRIVDSNIGNGVNVQYSVVLESSISHATKVGPFAYVRPESEIGQGARIGDFVEIKKSKIGDGTKVSHLTYIGDAIVGQNCNFGCGTVVVNYDGTKKHQTLIGDHAFIGCNTNLISPVKVGNNSYIAAGSTITDEVPDESLAIARARQVNKEGWVAKKGLWKK